MYYLPVELMLSLRGEREVGKERLNGLEIRGHETFDGEVVGHA